MVISKLPDPALVVNSNKTEFLHNTLLYAGTNKKYYYPAHETPYLFIINFLNKGRYTVNGQFVSVSEKCFYLLNPGDELAINFTSNQPLKTLFIFFKKEFIENSVYSITNSTDFLLDNPINPQKENLNIPNVPFLSDLIQNDLYLLHSSNYRSQYELDYQLFNLLTGFVKVNTALSVDLQKIKAIKTSTRQELHKRLFVAKEFIEDSVLTGSLSLTEMAAAACMNKFHFLTNFKDFYGATPHQYLINLKLQKAFLLLNKKNVSVTDVCYKVGFASPQSFSHLFKKKFNISPSALLG